MVFKAAKAAVSEAGQQWAALPSVSRGQGGNGSLWAQDSFHQDSECRVLGPA